MYSIIGPENTWKHSIAGHSILIPFDRGLRSELLRPPLLILHIPVLTACPSISTQVSVTWTFWDFVGEFGRNPQEAIPNMRYSMNSDDKSAVQYLISISFFSAQLIFSIITSKTKRKKLGITSSKPFITGKLKSKIEI